MLGYRYGLSQPGLRKNFSFTVPSAQRLDAIDAWIAKGLDTDPRSYVMQQRCAMVGCEAALRYLSQFLLTATVLLQDIKVPLFERAVLESIGQQGHRAQAQIWMPLPEGLSTDIVDKWIQQAMQAVTDLVPLLDDEQARESAYQTFHAKHIQPWRARIPGGQSTIPILQSAFEQGIAFSHLGGGRYVLGWGARSEIFDRSANSADSAIGATATQNKALAIHMLKAIGIPTPRGVLMPSGEFSAEKMQTLSKPWVIKPVDRDRGEGVSLNIETLAHAKVAFDKAATLSSGVLAEEQVAGTCHRILVVDGRVIYAVKRNPKTVVGDGLHSIAELIDLKNAALRQMLPIKRLPEYSLDADACMHLSRIGLSPDSVPPAGARVNLRAAQSTQWGGDPEDVTEQLHPDNAALAIKATQFFRLRCAGVDLISQDIGIPWFTNGAVINEVNFSPVIGRTHAYQRKATTAYMQALFPSKGRIPIEVYLGQDLHDSVAARCEEGRSRGLVVRVCSDTDTSVFTSTAMTRLDPTVQVLLVHLWRDTSLLWDSLPFPWITRIMVSASEVSAIKASPLWQTMAPLVSAIQVHRHA